MASRGANPPVMENQAAADGLDGIARASEASRGPDASRASGAPRASEGGRASGASRASEGSRATAERARTLVGHHFDFIWRVLRRLGVQGADVDDAAQQVFWVAVRKIDPEPSARDRAFLLSIALRVASEFRRRARSRRELCGFEHQEPLDPGRSPEQELELKDRIARADRVLEALPWDLRVVFVLYEVEEMATPEIAALLGIPLGTAASRLRRARASFLEAIETTRAQRPNGGRRR